MNCSSTHNTEPQLGREFTCHCDPWAKQSSGPAHFDEIASSLPFLSFRAGRLLAGGELTGKYDEIATIAPLLAMTIFIQAAGRCATLQ
jgi:hypothetical protein